MENEKKGFGYLFDKSLKTLKENLFILVPNLIFYMITGAITMAIMIPLMNGAASNPYALMNKFEANTATFIGAYFLFLFVIIAVSLFIESGNMYMIRNVVKGESNGLSDFMNGLTKYPHKLLGFGLVMTLIFVVLYLAIILLVLMAAKLGTFIAVIIGIAVFVFFVFLAVVFQPYDAVMAVGDNGAIDTISKTFKFGKSNFLSLFLLVCIVVLITLLFQGAASVTSGVGSFGASMSGRPEFSIVPFVIVYIIQLLVGLLLRVFSRIFKFHLYHENSGDFAFDADGIVLNDYAQDDAESRTTNASNNVNIEKENDSNVDLSKSEETDEK